MFKDNFRTGSFCVKLESSKKNLVCMTVRAIGDGGPGALDKKWLKKPNLSYGKLLFFQFLRFNYMSIARGVIKNRILASWQCRIKKNLKSFLFRAGEEKRLKIQSVKVGRVSFASNAALFLVPFLRGRFCNLFCFHK